MPTLHRATVARHAVLYSNGVLTYISASSEHPNSRAMAINAAVEMVGYLSTSPLQRFYCMRRHGRHVTDVHAAGGTQWSYQFAVTSTGMIKAGGE